MSHIEGCQAEIAHSVQRIATGWTVKVRTPVRSSNFVFSKAIRTGPGFLHLPLQWVRLVRRPQRGVDNPTHLDPRLRMASAMTLIRLCAVITCYGETFIFTFTHLNNYNRQTSGVKRTSVRV